MFALVQALHNATELTYLFASTFTILICIRVLYVLHPMTKAARRKQALDRTGKDHLSLGVTVSFFAKVLDGIYWQLTWTLKFIGCPFSPTLVDWGVFPNIFFRCILGAIAAMYHLKAARAATQLELKSNEFWWMMIFGLLSIAYDAVILLIRDMA